MGQVVVDITMSLDGYVAAPGVDLEHGLGVGGEALHDWVMEGRTEVDSQVLDAAVEATGAVVMGRRLFDVVDGPNGWRGDMGYGAERDQSRPPPYFVVTHRAPEAVRLEAPYAFTFVTDGIASAVRQAKAAADKVGKDVVVMGGASVCTQCVAAGLADVVWIHLAPVLLGGGTRLFDDIGGAQVPLEITEVIESARATHIRYRVA
ncbi:dihydrofolate reductase family protein [Streptomyces sp. 6N223]|uniref:dihydrofolate reductase family protein n=1 Tax=Streptomyces sp. 6N223 TaxID=3457412 RepID=UPI003FD63071